MPTRTAEEASGEERDLLSALPDEILQHVLSFLPSVDVEYRTCLLARRWRDLWRFTPALRITHDSDDSEDTNDFVNRLLLFRDHTSPLLTCEIKDWDCFDPFEFDIPNVPLPCRYIALWIRYALKHQARVLRVSTSKGSKHLKLDWTPLISQHLAVLELGGAELTERGLDLSRYPALTDLKITNCLVTARKISSQSVRRLVANDNNYGQGRPRVRISIPSLVSLQLNGIVGLAPVLESMPLLETALVAPGKECLDRCGYSTTGNCNFVSCKGCNDSPDDMCVLLSGLSNATDLKLIDEPNLLIFKRDLTLCPTFSKLKTLLLSGWSVSVDLSPVVCLLRHSPILEKLSFRLYKIPEQEVEVEGSKNPEPRYALAHLKVVEGECREIEESAQNFSNFYGIPAGLITIREPSGSCYSSCRRAANSIDKEVSPNQHPSRSERRRQRRQQRRLAMTS
ncbi:unnamed protein product [Urochloa decumbens]|uniref:F-box domain-containing protein n=1 Tax=Urochloa decumbens TaxID=240449 RepID=A0ABC9B4U9_9POAL